jgi:cytochrome oxidase assembly protein ShyY1
MPHHRRQTIGTIAVVAVLLALGIWVFARLDESQRAQACLESAGRKCAVIGKDGALNR